MAGEPERLILSGLPAIEIFDLLPSTNVEARRRIATAQAADGWIVARAQSEGRGRRGRAWVSEKGNLFASRIVEPRAPASRAPELSFVASLATFDAISAHLPPTAGPVACKWPNDVLISRRKVAGLLLESEGSSGWVVVGIGVNVTSAPTDVEFPATSLQEHGSRATALDVLKSLASVFEHWYEIWRDGGFAPIRDAWRQRAAGMGETIRIRLEMREFTGTFMDIDETGALLVRLSGGTIERVAAGDVFFV